MRILIQIVNEASVTIEEKEVAHIKEGILIFVGFTLTDEQEIVEKMVDKLLGLRIFPDEQGKTNLNINDVAGEILSVSQFTLYADTRKGRRPSFTNALGGDKAESLYEYFNYVLKTKHDKVATGVFGADMQVGLINYGPMTILLDSEEIYGR